MLVVALMLAAVTSAGGQATDLRLGGGTLPGPVKESTPARALAIGVLIPAARDSARLRIGFLIRCGKRLRGDDVLLRVPLSGDTFAGKRTVKSDELRRATVSVTGTLAGDRASGTAKVSGPGCRSLTYRWQARSVSLERPADAAPVVTPRSTLLGFTDAPGPIPHGLVLKVGARGRNALVFTSTVLRCRFSGRFAKRPRKTYDVQETIYGTLSKAGRSATTRTGRQTAREQRRGIRRSFRSTFAARFRGDVVTGAYRSSSRYREPGYSERCAVPRFAFAAKP